MKILITENKRYQLAYKILDDILDGLTREDTDLNRGKDSVFSNHQVSFFEEHLESGWRFSGKKKTINYSDIESVEISEKDQSFATLIIRLSNKKKIVFYFVDKPEELKTWIEQHKNSTSSFSQAA